MSQHGNEGSQKPGLVLFSPAHSRGPAIPRHWCWALRQGTTEGRGCCQEHRAVHQHSPWPQPSPSPGSEGVDQSACKAPESGSDSPHLHSCPSTVLSPGRRAGPGLPFSPRMLAAPVKPSSTLLAKGSRSLPVHRHVKRNCPQLLARQCHAP